MKKLEDELILVDALGDRWGKYGELVRGGLHPLEAMRLMHDGAVLGGGPEGMPGDIKAWDETVEHEDTPNETRALLKVWYCQRMPAAAKADRLGMSRAQLYTDWGKALWFMKGALRVHGVKL